MAARNATERERESERDGEEKENIGRRGEPLEAASISCDHT